MAETTTKRGCEECEKLRAQRDRLADTAQELVVAWELWNRGRMDEAVEQLRRVIADTPAPKGEAHRDRLADELREA